MNSAPRTVSTNRVSKQESRSVSSKATLQLLSHLNRVLLVDPVVGLIVGKDKVISIEAVNNSVGAAESLNVVHLSLGRSKDVSEVALSSASLKESDLEASWLEDLKNVLDNLLGLTARLLGWDVGLEGSVRADWLWSNVDVEVVCALLLHAGIIVLGLWSWDNTVGTETAWAELVGINDSIWVMAGWVDRAQSASLANNCSQSVTLNSKLLWDGSWSSNASIAGSIVGGSSNAIRACRHAAGSGSLKELLLSGSNRVLEIELTSVLWVHVSHENLEGLIIVADLLGLVESSVLSTGWAHEPEVPMVAVHLANEVGRSLVECGVKKSDLIFPAFVWPNLSVWEQEVLAGVEDAVWLSLESLGSNVNGAWEADTGSAREDLLESEQEGGGSAGLENDFMWEDEHARLREQVRVNLIGLDNREDLAVNHVQSDLPGLLGDSLQSKLS